jgi:hypothetical protein
MEWLVQNDFHPSGYGLSDNEYSTRFVPNPYFEHFNVT